MRDWTIPCSRFVHAAALAALLPGAAAAMQQAPPREDGELRVGVVLAPGDAALQGARFGAAEAGHTARLIGAVFTVHEAGSAPGTAAAAAERLIREHGVNAIVGGSTPADADALSELAARERVLFMNVGAALEAMRHRCSAFTFHVAPSNAMRLAVLAAAPAPLPPDARALSWHPLLERFGAAQVSDRFEAHSGQRLRERAWEGWIAMKILFDASQRARTTEPAALAAFLVTERSAFDGHKGMQLSFHPGSRQLRQPLYAATHDRVIAEVPVTRGAGDISHADLLDRFGTPGISACSP
jgi:ABC-type branched-subunit amino acid transport system substrate-binding protein